MHSKNSENAYSIKSVTKTIELLEVLVECGAGAGLTQLSASVNLSGNATFRIMQTLCEKGLVEQDEHNNYSLGVRSTTLAQKMLKNSSMVMQYAHPILEELARHHDEAAYMTILKDGEVLFLDMVDCEQQIKASPLVGKRFPFFSNAAGKVMRAMESADILEKLFKKPGRPRKDMPDLVALDQEMIEIRRRGVAVDFGGLGEGIISVAVAVKDYSGKVVGAVTLIAPAFRMLGNRIENEIIPSLKEGADLLSGRFGYCPA